MRILHLDEVDSTNAFIMREADRLQAPLMVVAHTQTAGQGQRGNSWEAEPGANLTFSIFHRPSGLPPMSQFAMSEAVALGVADFLKVYGIEAKVKWPNDIYVGDKKICGILIRHSITSDSISWSIIGIGINVNQQAFLSDAPNPVSMRQLTGKSYSLDEMEKEIAGILEKRISGLHDEKVRMRIHQEFLSRLWRGDGNFYPFSETASGLTFSAAIHDIALHGPLTLRLGDGSLRTYAFKEISFLP